MQVRFPDFDFQNIRAHWSKVPEFAQSYNSFSIVPAHVEPFLVKVMRRVKKALGDSHPQLQADIDIFNKQEMQHCKHHLAFNRRIYELGYPQMAEIEKPYKADYDRFFETKSLRFCLAYCEGFEAMGAAAAYVYFEHLGDYLEDADEEAMNLWKWHLAEEFEHRSVCAEAYRILYGSGPFAYLYRVWGFIFAVRHIHSYVKQVNEYLLARDREGMTPDELAQSIERQKELEERVARASRQELKAVFSPFYDPGKKRVTPAMQAVLESYAS